jgi:hypothetical protein
MSHIRQIAAGPAVRPGEIWFVEQAEGAPVAGRAFTANGLAG